METDYTARLGALKQLERDTHTLQADDAEYWLDRAELERMGAAAVLIWLMDTISAGTDPLEAVLQAFKAELTHSDRLHAARCAIRQAAISALMAADEDMGGQA